MNTAAHPTSAAAAASSAPGQNTAAVPETPRDAATVVLLRDSARGMEVLLLRRNAQASNMAGAYVFPGGKLDKEDSELLPEQHLDQDSATLHQRLHETSTSAAMAAGLHVAALREALEECGLLLAQPLHGVASAQQQLIDAPQARSLLRGGMPLAQVLAQLQLRLATRALTPWSRWITPLIPNMGTRRFDTRFFLAQAPTEQVATHDGEETTDSVWIAPRTALEQYRDQQISLAPPQIMSLAHLARHQSVASAVAEAQAKQPPVIMPESFQQGDVRIICYPGDARHSVSVRAMPGPTRLHMVQKRFEAEGGLEALWS